MKTVNEIVFNSLPNDKILDVTKLKAFADNKINVAQMMIPVFDRVENIVGKGENAGYQHFLLFLQCFQKATFSGWLKFRIVWQRVTLFTNRQCFRPVHFKSIRQ